MKLSLNTNIGSLRAQNQLLKASEKLQTSFERLSSGLRINRASDDPAGLAMASGLQTDSRLMAQAVRNVNDGISLLTVAESALKELNSILGRQAELAQQAANGTYSNQQRVVIDKEAQALSGEFLRVARSTQFNSLGLFDGSLGSGLQLQAGYGVDGSIQSTLGHGLGTGNFSDRCTFGTQTGNGTSRSYAATLGDVNNDGVLDLVTAGFAAITTTQGQASVLIGQGDGTFTDKRTFATETSGSGTSYSWAVSLGDVNGDGVLDLVTAGFATNGTYQGQASVLIGRGDGTFTDKRTFATETGSGASRSQAVSLGDVNGDGVLDLVTAGFANNGSAQGQASVLLGNGDGTFSNKITFATETGSGASQSHAVSLGDVNGDGVLDLVTAGYANNGSAQGQVSVLLGNGDGTFGNKLTFATETGSGASQSRAVSLGDVNGDGVLDLVTAGWAWNGKWQGQASVLLGNGDGTFGNKLTFATETGSGNCYSYAVSLGDVNGDGLLDLVTAGYGNNGSTQGQASVLLGNGDGTFGNKLTFATETGSGTSRSRAVSLGDVNGDGVLDLVTAGEANNGSEQGQASVLSAVLREGIAPVLPFSLRTVADARQAMGIIDNKLDLISLARGKIGAFQSRISHTVKHLQIMSENYAAANSKIVNADIAEEVAQMVRQQILQQAITAVMAQANQQTALVLELLK